MTEPLSELLQNADFWRYYVLGENHELPESLIARFAQRGEEEDDWEPVCCELPVGDAGCITLEVGLDLWSKELGLKLRGDNRVYELGWWDEARWHPYAFRWQELERMYQHWQDHPDRLEMKPKEAFLLLACFVGTASDETSEVSARRKVVREAYGTLGVLKASELGGLSERTILIVEPDYRWTRVDGLGWTFSGEYSCYSLRNTDHTGGQEGTFPIRRFEALLEQL